jgi:excisionase family DNA binding protein
MNGTLWSMTVAIRPNTDTFFTTSEAAEYLGLAEDTIRRYIYRGLIFAKKHGRDYQITKSECDRYSKEKRSPGRQPAA